MFNDREKEANDLVNKANKLLKPSFFQKMLTYKENRLEEALDYYEKAANLFKLAKNWNMAGECYENCGRIEEELNSDSSAGHYHDASHCYSFVDKIKAKINTEKCLKVYENLGRFQMAGKIQKQVAESLENDLNYNEAIEAFRRAGDYFSMENLNSKSYEQACRLKEADLMCITDHEQAYQISSGIYEKIGLNYLTIPLLASGAKELFFKCIVVHLAYSDDYVFIENKLNNLLMEDPTFDGTREANFLKEVMEAIKNKNVEEFKAAVTKLKTYSDFGKWKINMFTKIINKIENFLNDEKEGEYL